MEGGGPQRFRHLEFVREDPTAERRRRSFYSPPPDRGGRQVFAPKLIEAAERLEDEQQGKPAIPRGLQPHLIFRMPVAASAPRDSIIQLLEQAGLVIVSLEPDGAIIAFREDTHLQEFKEAAEQYAAGPGINRKTGLPYKTTKYDILEYVEPDQMRLLAAQDKVAPRLAELIGAHGQGIDDNKSYVVELELWHPGNRLNARRSAEELRAFIQSRNVPAESFLDSYVGDFLVLVKVRVRGDGLRQLLNADVVAVVDLPPRADFNPIEIRAMAAGDFPEPRDPPPNGPRVCVVDSGISSNHPLLRRHVGHAQSFLRGSTSSADQHGHGTMVAGLAVFGDVSSAVTNRRFQSPVTVLSARVLNEHNEFEDDRLVINQLKDVLETFAAAPYNCRVFNLSLGTRHAADDLALGRQTLWAEQLDILARELKVVLVVSAGNVAGVLAARGNAAEEIVTRYPSYLFEDHAKLADPATAAIALTVGALMETEELSALPRAGQQDIRRIIGSVNNLSPITRTGPGVNGAIKPELVHYGGGLCLGGFGEQANRVIERDPALSVTSLCNDPNRSLFSFDVGTSFAAPRVARLAALVQVELAQVLGRESSPNTIRAVLANSARIPAELLTALQNDGGFPSALRSCGYGIPTDEQAITSSARRVTLLSEESLKLDYFHVYKVPVSREFVQAQGVKTISVALAFDPPVRRRRLEYLGVEMDFLLLRGMNLQQVTDACKKVPKGSELDSAIPTKFKVSMVPSSTSRSGYARKRSTLQKGIAEMRGTPRNDYGEEYWLVVRAERNWAPSEIEAQTYSLAVTLIADYPRLYEQVRARIRQRARLRTRA